jgi:hypothetical protein
MKLLAVTRLPPFGLDSGAGQMNLGLERITSPTDLVGTMLLEIKSPLADLQPIRSRRCIELYCYVACRPLNRDAFRMSAGTA